MSDCPYEEYYIDEYVDDEVVNEKYFAWHEGYEACKKDLASWANELRKQMEDEVSKTKQLRVELLVKYYEDKQQLLEK